jgi:galactose mutarotase-like enzyme
MVQKENVLIQVGECTITVLPQFGGKVASILVRGHELLQTPLKPYAPRTKTMGFNEGDASGWDECLPTVSGGTVQTVNGPVELADHGDLWRVEWKVLSSANGSLSLEGECFTLPLKLRRTLTLSQTEKGYRIHADYQVTNTGSFETPWSWSAHPGYLAEEGDLLHLPESIHSLRLEWSNNERIGKPGDTVKWPMAKLTAGGETDLRVSSEAHSGNGDKLFAGPLTANQNWIALDRLKAGVRLKVGFDPVATPYLGMWICQDGYPEGGSVLQHCVAMEPCTAPVDSLAVTGPWSRTLTPGSSFAWPMTLDLEML